MRSRLVVVDQRDSRAFAGLVADLRWRSAAGGVLRVALGFSTVVLRASAGLQVCFVGLGSGTGLH